MHRGDAHELAVVDDRHARADLLHLAQDVAGDEHSLALGREVTQEIAHLDDAGGVQAVGRLIEDQDVRVVEQGQSQAEALLHAHGVGPHAIAIATFQRHDLQHLVDALLRRPAKQIADSAQVVAPREVAVKRWRLDERADSRQDL